MKTIERPMIAVLVIVSVIAAGLLLDIRPAMTTDEQVNETRARMRGFFVTLTGAYKYSLDENECENPDNYEAVLRALRGLADAADELEMHAGDLDPSFDYLKRSLARDARAAGRGDSFFRTLARPLPRWRGLPTPL